MIQAVIGIVLIYFSFSISSSLIPSVQEPNDFVCTVESGQDFLQEFQEKYEGTQKSFPFVYVNNEGGSEVRIGIALSDFNRVFDRKEELGQDEIISLKSDEDVGSLVNTSVSGQMSDKLFLGQDVGDTRLEEQEYRQNFFSVVIMGIVGVAVLFFGMFIAWLKIFAETGQMEAKYEFLEVAGMKSREKRRTLRKETGLTIWLPMAAAAVTAGLFCASFIFKNYGGSGNGRPYYYILLFLLAVYIVLEVVFMSVVRLWMQRRILTGDR